MSWEVTAASMGEASRKEMFDPDQTLRPEFHADHHPRLLRRGIRPRARVPHGDRTANLEMSYATFVMTNVIPQATQREPQGIGTA